MNTTTVYNHIVDTAETLIQTQGYNAFSYGDIAKTVGIKTASIHYYFPTKAELGKAVVSRRIEALQQALNELLANKGLSNKKKLQLFLDNIFATTYARDRRMCLGGMLASDVLTLPEVIQFEVRRFFNHLEKWLEQLLTQGRSNEEFAFTGTAKKQAAFILALVEGSLLLARLFQDEDKFHTVRKQIEAHLY